MDLGVVIAASTDPGFTPNYVDATVGLAREAAGAATAQAATGGRFHLGLALGAKIFVEGRSASPTSGRPRDSASSSTPCDPCWRPDGSASAAS